jgi:hypothetical protein
VAFADEIKCPDRKSSSELHARGGFSGQVVLSKWLINKSLRRGGIGGDAGNKGLRVEGRKGRSAVEVLRRGRRFAEIAGNRGVEWVEG